MDDSSPRPRLGRPSKDVADDGTAQAGLARAVRFWREECPPVGKPTQLKIAAGTRTPLGQIKKQLYGDALLAHDVVMFIAREKATAAQLEEWESLYNGYVAAHHREQEGFEVEQPAAPSWQRQTSTVTHATDISLAPAEETPSNDIEQSSSDESPVSDEPDALPSRLRRISRPRLVISVVVLVLIAVGVAVALGLSRDRTPTTPAVSGPRRTITVQNKVALGTSVLTEDKTPAYLSTVPRPYCADEVNNCEVSGSQMQSGAAVLVDCVAFTDFPMINYDAKDPGAVTNPDAVRSRLWYHGERNGKSGFISEIYIAARDRNGLGLPTCPSS